MALDFIFMLTRHDRTVSDAFAHLPVAIKAGVRHIGFKDVGLPAAALKELNAAIHEGGATSYLEVVSLDREQGAAAAALAVGIGVDRLLGAGDVRDIAPILAASPVQFFPFPGQVCGHPSVLEGSIAEITASARQLAARDDVHGLDLLAYRSAVNAPALIAAVCEAAAPKPVIVAGSIDSPERIQALSAAGAAGFTIGTAALDGRFPATGGDLDAQLGAILRAAGDEPALETV